MPFDRHVAKIYLPHLSGNLTNLSQIFLNFAQQPEFYLFV